MTRPDHTAVPPAGVIAAAEPFAWVDPAKLEHGMAYATKWKTADKQVPLYARAEGVAPTAAQAAPAAGRSELLAELREALRWALSRIEHGNLGMGDRFAAADRVLAKADEAATPKPESATSAPESATGGASGAAKVALYTYRRNHCDCHPETCCCDPWEVLTPGGERLATCFDKRRAERLADHLNRDSMRKPE